MPRMGACSVFVAIALPFALAGCQGHARTATPGTSATAESEVEVVEHNFPDGTLRIREHVIRGADGSAIKHGLYTRWYPNGNKEYEVTYVRDAKHGTSTFWHRNGQKWTQDSYVNGVIDGSRVTWDDKGRMRKEEQYSNGKPHGTWTVFRDDGSIKWRGFFDHGKPVDDPPKDATE